MTTIEHEEVLKTFALFAKWLVEIASCEVIGNYTDAVSLS